MNQKTVLDVFWRSVAPQMKHSKNSLLSTKEVASLLGLAPSTICAYGQEFEDAGFVFTRAGTRKGGEIAWSISKAIGL